MAGFTYEIRLRDVMSQGFQKAAKASGTFYNKITADQKKFKANLDRIPNSINGITSKLSELTRKRDSAFSKKAIVKYNQESLDIRTYER